MADWKCRLLGLGLPCFLAWLFDVGMTFHGQPAAYWAGDYGRTTEGSPFFARLFEIHPLAAVAGEVLWLSIIFTWLLLMPEVLAVILAVAIVFGHTAGGFTWFGLLLERRWFQTLHGIFFVSATVLGVGLYWFLWIGRRPDSVRQERRLHPVFRWSLLAVASALAIYFYLIPQ
jgi:hypothetical protein